MKHQGGYFFVFIMFVVFKTYLIQLHVFHNFRKFLSIISPNMTCQYYWVFALLGQPSIHTIYIMHIYTVFSISITFFIFSIFFSYASDWIFSGELTSSYFSYYI